MHFTANINYNQCDQIRQNVAIWPKILSLWQFVWGVFSIRQNLKYSLANIHATGHIFINLNGQILNRYYSHLVTLSTRQHRSKLN